MASPLTKASNSMTNDLRPIKRLGNDLYCKVECNCPDPKWANTDVAHMFNRAIWLYGYADDNFFDRVNAEPHETKCECGRRLKYRWFRDGVVAEFADEAVTQGATT